MKNLFLAVRLSWNLPPFAVIVPLRYRGLFIIYWPFDDRITCRPDPGARPARHRPRNLQDRKRLARRERDFEGALRANWAWAGRRRDRRAGRGQIIAR